jgi:rhamnosyl/mannosyltransferase
LLPHLDETAFVDLLWAADLFVLPSTQNSEAFGIVQLEAMACETPVVTFDLPTGVTWVNRHDETGIVVRGIDPVRLAHGINRLLDDEQLRCVLGKQARKRVEETFDVKQSVAAVLDACDSSATRVPALQSVR